MTPAASPTVLVVVVSGIGAIGGVDVMVLVDTAIETSNYILG